MSRSRESNDRAGLTVAIAISVLLHLVAGVVVFGRLDAEATGRPVEAHDEEFTDPQDQLEPPPQPRLRLGIERSSHASVTWLGFEVPEEHQVTEMSIVEQAALAVQDVSGMRSGVPEASGQEVSSVPHVTHAPPPPEPEAMPTIVTARPPADQPIEAVGNAGPDVPAPPEKPTSPPTPPVVLVPTTGIEREGPARDAELVLSNRIGAKPPETTDAPDEPAAVPAEPDPVVTSASGDVSDSAIRVESPDGPRPAATEPVADRPVEKPETPAPSEEPPPVDRAQPTSPAPGEQPGESVGNSHALGEGDALRIGLRSDKESPASALKRAMKYRPSKPPAVQGLELKTVEPRWPVSVRLTSSPRNPVVVIHFDRRGVVTRADFLKDEKKQVVYSTGEPAVDEPLRTAIFQWRAKGEELLRIPADNPDATVSIVMEILLNSR